MLPESYHLEIFNNACMPGAMTVQCFAHLDQDVSAALLFHFNDKSQRRDSQ